MPEINDIEWEQRPLWGYGGGAMPVDFASYARHLYSGYSDSNYVMTNDMPGWVGAFMLNLANSSTLFPTGSNASGTAPNAWIGPETFGDIDGFTSTILTMVFPKANRRFALKMTMARTLTATTINYTSAWYDATTGDAVSDVTYPGMSTSQGWIDSYLSAAGLPGCVAVTYEVPGYGKCYGVGYVGVQDQGDHIYMTLSGVAIDVDTFAAKLQELYPALDFSEYETYSYSPEAGPESRPGGYSSYGAGGDITDSDSAPWPDMPGVSIAQLGFINIYNPSAGGLTNLGEEIFPDLNFTPQTNPSATDVTDAIIAAAVPMVGLMNQVPDMFKVYMNSRLIDYVQDCHWVPVKPPSTFTGYIKLGYRTLNISAPVVDSEYVDVSLGTVKLKEFTTTFLDYLPYTRAKVYLPFVGFVPLEPEYWQSGIIEVKYRFNVYDGSFMCGILSSPNAKVSKMQQSLIAQYTGTAVTHIPLTGLNYSSMVSGLIGGAGTMMTAIASGNPAAAAQAALNTATASPQVMNSNSYTASAALLGMRYPFILFERTNQHYPKLYEHDKGMPSKISTNLGAAKGFVTVKDADLSGFQATEAEKEEIRKLLAGGIYV